LLGPVASPTYAAAGAALAPTGATAPTPSGVTSGSSDGRAIFNGNIGLAPGMSLSGALTPLRLAGASQWGPLPGTRLPAPRSAKAARVAPGDQAAGIGTQSPQRGDLITDFKPYDRTSLEQAIDRFLARFDDLGAELSQSAAPTDLLTEIAAVAVAFTAAKVGLRLFWRSRDEDENAPADAALGVELDPCPGAADV
jgi:hypothetical protein